MYLMCIALFFAACQEKVPNSNKDVSIDTYQSFSRSGWSINSHHIRRCIDSLLDADKDSMTADFRLRSYYLQDGPFLWIDRAGLDDRADTLLARLREVEQMGFSPRQFCIGEIEEDLKDVRTLHIDSTRANDVNAVLARLEYHLTKAYLRYAAGQRFGFANPNFLLNRLDTLEPSRYDTVARPVRYRGLFDIHMQHPDRGFFMDAIRKAKSDSLAQFLSDIQPKSPFYRLLQSKLSEKGLSVHMRAKLLCNMERCRWRLTDYPQSHEKYVLVNLPSQRLMAINGSDTLSMRIGCGSYKTKTPLLTSRIKRMDVNPRWNIPRSIIDRDIVHHAGNRHYFESRRFYVVNRSTGKEVDLGAVTYSMLRSKDYGVVQRGGKGNSLGRIIFRFDNNFSVFLHDTSSRSVFQRGDRSVSHGCVRVEKPFDLAVFLMGNKKPQLIDKLKYSMTADSLDNRQMVIGSINVEPQVPIFITYFTLYPMAGGEIREYADIYGYDKVIYRSLLNYL